MLRLHRLHRITLAASDQFSVGVRSEERGTRTFPGVFRGEAELAGQGVAVLCANRGSARRADCARMVGKQEVIQLSENADSDLGPAGSSRIRAFFERYILPCRLAFTNRNHPDG